MQLNFMVEGTTIALIAGISSIVTSLVTVAVPMLIKRHQSRAKMDLCEGMEKDDKVHDILGDLRFNLDAERVTLWYGSNGDTTFALHHLKKMSITNESCRDGLDGIKEECQLIPIAIFERQLRDLWNINDDVLQSFELSKKDTLSSFFKKYDMNNLYYCKVFGNWNNWAGILVVSFTGERALSPTDLFDINLAAKKITAI